MNLNIIEIIWCITAGIFFGSLIGIIGGYIVGRIIARIILGHWGKG